jgi:hypothetical protein
MFRRSKTVDFIGAMLDAGYLMLDIPEFAGSEIQKHPVSRIQDHELLPMIFITTAKFKKIFDTT